MLAVARRALDGPRPPQEEAESGLTLLGLVGMLDPPRPEVTDAVAACRRAGIRVVMVTGDHPLTGEAVARRVGIVRRPDPVVVTGARLDAMDGEALDSLLAEPSELLLCRVSPEHKMRVVTAFQRRGEVVAVTGDGANDAPALKHADIGVAMGASGTDVAREAASMVLLDDSFASIATAVRLGRSVYQNIRKFLIYVFSSNIGELGPILVATFAGFPLVPLSAVQILAIDLGSDVMPALALGAEGPEADVMDRPPRSRRERLFSAGVVGRILFLGGIQAPRCRHAGERRDGQHQVVLRPVLVLLREPVRGRARRAQRRDAVRVRAGVRRPARRRRTGQRLTRASTPTRCAARPGRRSSIWATATTPSTARSASSTADPAPTSSRARRHSRTTIRRSRTTTSGQGRSATPRARTTCGSISRAGTVAPDGDVLDGDIRDATGGFGDDVVIGTDAPNTLATASPCGLITASLGYGSDRILGLGGDDVLMTGIDAGASIFYDPHDRDVTEAGAGDDTITVTSRHDAGNVHRCGAGRDAVIQVLRHDFVDGDCERLALGADEHYAVHIHPRASVFVVDRVEARKVAYAGDRVVARGRRNVRLNALGRRLLARRGRLKVTVEMHDRRATAGFRMELRR